MILPTPEFNPMFADDGVPFQEKMIRYIQREFPDLLGAAAYLPATKSTLEIISRIAQMRYAEFASVKETPPSSRDAA